MTSAKVKFNIPEVDDAVAKERDYYRNLVQQEKILHQNELASAELRLDTLESENASLRQEIENLRGEILANAAVTSSANPPATSAENETPTRPVEASSAPTQMTERLENAQHALRNRARSVGRKAIGSLPVSNRSKLVLKRNLLRVVAPVLGLSYRQVSAAGMRGNRSEPSTVERYLALAATARGVPNNVPSRSVSIVIPVYNQLSYTLACLDSLREHTSDIEYEIIVVDDCSSDETQETLVRHADVLYVRNEKNLGFIGSCNAGAALATKNYVCFLNNDTTVTSGWLSALVNTFELHENVGLAGSKLVYPNGQLQEAGGLIWEDGSGWNWGRNQDPTNPRFNYARNADYCSGAAILVPHALFSSLGGFDPHYTPAYGEDSDLAFKIRSMGLATVYQPLSEVVHFEGITSGTDTSQGVKKHQVVNAQKLAKRWAPALVHQGENGVDAHLAADRGVVGRVLVLDQISPEPDRDAGSITALELMRAIRDLGHKVTFAPVSNYCYLPPYTDTLSALGIEQILMPWAGSFREHMREFGAGYDAVLIFRPPTWDECIDVVRKHAPQARIIYHSSDLHFLRAEREAELSGDHNASDVNADRKKAELEIITGADLCIVHSTMEKELLEEIEPGSKVACFPWIYEARGKGQQFSDRHGIIYLGGYGHEPNVDAVEYYVDAIHPKVEAELPANAQFIAAGSKPPTKLMELAGPRIQVPGYIEDITPTLFETRVMVVPLRYGAGIKGKILTAMAHGLPIVTTTVGAEGMELTDGEHVLVADTPEDFAAATLRLYRDQALWERLQTAGLDYVKNTISRKAGLATVSQLLSQIDIATTPCSVPDLPEGASTAFGSRPEVSDLSSLVGAGERALGVSSSNIACPRGCAKDVASDCHNVFQFDKSRAELLEGPIVAFAELGNPNEIRALAQNLKSCVSQATPAAVVFVPPKLGVSQSEYVMTCAFTGEPATAVERPPHEVWGEAFAYEGMEQTWTVDRKLTGFPSIFVVTLTPKSS